MTDLARLGIVVDSTQVLAANKNLDQLAKSGAAADKSTQNLAKSTKELTNQLNPATAATALFNNYLQKIAASLALVKIIQLADQYKLLEARLRLVTDSTQDLLIVQQKLFQASQETRTSFASTVDLYARVARSAGNLKLSQGQLLDVTMTVQKAIQISGASATEAAAGMLQLSQALASGRLQGDELRSILENMPRLASAIATGMGVSIGSLRQLGAEGKLTSKVIADAIIKAGPQIQKEFERIPLTVGQAFQKLENSFLKFIGEMDSSTGVTGVLASAISNLADVLGNLSRLLNIAAAVGLALFITKIFEASAALTANSAIVASNAAAVVAAETAKTAAVTASSAALAVAETRLVAVRTANLGLAGSSVLAAEAEVAQATATLAANTAMNASAAAAVTATKPLPFLARAWEAVGVAARGAMAWIVANPFTAIIVAITAAISALVVYADKIELGKVKLSEIDKKTADLIKSQNALAKQSGEISVTLADYWAVAADYINKIWVQNFQEIYDTIVSYFKAAFDLGPKAFINGIINGIALVVTTIYNLGTIIEEVLSTAFDNVSGKATAFFQNLKNASTGDFSFKNSYQTKGIDIQGLASGLVDARDVMSRDTVGDAMNKVKEYTSEITKEAAQHAILRERLEAETLAKKKNSDGTKDLTKATKEHVAELTKYIIKLDEEMQIAEAELNLVGKSNVEREQAKVLIEATTKAHEDYRKKLRTTNDLTAEEIDLLKNKTKRLIEAKDAQERLTKLVEETRTPQEKYNKELAETQDLMRFAKTPEAIEAVRRKLEELKDQANPLAKAFENAAEQIQKGFSDAFYNLFTGANKGFKGLVDSFKQMFFRLLAEMATLAIARPVIIPLVGAAGSALGVSNTAINSVANNLGGSGSDVMSLASLGSSALNLLKGGTSQTLVSGFDKVGSLFGIGDPSFIGPMQNGGLAGGLSQYSTFTNGAWGGSLGASAGGIGGNLLANAIFGGNRGIGADIGGGIGAIAGSFIPVPIVGTLVGSFLGNFFGGLFGGKKPSNKEQGGNISLGGGAVFDYFGQTGNKFSQENKDAATGFLQFGQALAASVASATGKEIENKLQIKIGSRDGFAFSIDGGAETRTAGNAAEFMKALTLAIADLGGKTSEAVINLNTAIGKIDFTKAEDAVKDINFALAFSSLGDDPAKPITAVEQALIELNKTYDDMVETAKRLGLEESKVNIARDKAIAQLKNQYTQNIKDQILQMTDPMQYALNQLDKAFETVRTEAKALGVDSALIEDYYGKSRNAILQQYGYASIAITNSMTTEQIKSQQAAYNAWKDSADKLQEQRAAEISSLRDQINALKGAADGWARLTDQLAKFKQSLQLDKGLSPLTPEQRLQAARDNFNSISSRALAGDQDAISQLQDASTSLLNESRSYFATSEDYLRDFTMVNDILDRTQALTQRQTDLAQQQYSTLNSQLIVQTNAYNTLQQILSSLQTPAPTGANNNAGGGSLLRPGEDPSILNGFNTLNNLPESVVRQLKVQTGFNFATDGLQYSYLDWVRAGNQAAGQQFNALVQQAGGTPQGFANGGYTPTDRLFMTGERGPELQVNGNPGVVFNAKQTKRMLESDNDNSADEVRKLRVQLVAGMTMVADTIKEGNADLKQVRTSVRRKRHRLA